MFVQVTVEQRDRAMNVSQEVRTGVLFMVDLAGSERAAVTQVHILNSCAHIMDATIKIWYVGTAV